VHACFYRYAEQEGLIAVSPAAHVRRPRLDYESHATGLDRNEVGAMLVAAGLAGGRDHALISVLALNGLRVSEALGADIEDLGNVTAGAIQRIAIVMGPGLYDPHLTPENIAENYAKVESIEGFSEPGPFEPGTWVQMPTTD
jgi:site-specific recombinase XerD